MALGDRLADGDFHKILTVIEVTFVNLTDFAYYLFPHSGLVGFAAVRG